MFDLDNKTPEQVSKFWTGFVIALCVGYAAVLILAGLFL